MSKPALLSGRFFILCAQHGRNLTGESPECRLIIVGTVNSFSQI